MDFKVTTNLRTYGLTGFATYRVARDATFALCTDGEEVASVALEVASEEEARADFAAYVADEEYRDNHRAAYADDTAAMARYVTQEGDGCCGSADRAYSVNGRLFWLGCNYGH